MNISDELGLSWKKVRDTIFDRIVSLAVDTGEHPGNDISIFLFFYLECKVTFTCWTAEDFYDFLFHTFIPLINIPLKILLVVSLRLNRR
jgi:hypothetical protein